MSFCDRCIHLKDCKADLHKCCFYEEKRCGTCKHEFKAITAEPCYNCNKFYDKWEACHE